MNRQITKYRFFFLLILGVLHGMKSGATHIGNDAAEIRSRVTFTDAISASEIDNAVSEAINNGRIVTVQAGGLSLSAAIREVVSLPVIFRTEINGLQYDIVVMSMQFKANGASMRIGARLLLGDGKTAIHFGNKQVPMSGKSGFKGELPILAETLSADKVAELNDPASLLRGETQFMEFSLPGFKNNMTMGLAKETKMNFSCGAFNNLRLSGFVKAYNIVENEAADGATVEKGKPLLLVFDQQVDDWTDMMLSTRVSSGFHAGNYPDLGFHFDKDVSAFIDLSNVRNLDTLPACATTSGKSWQGVVFKEFTLRLPQFLKLKPGVTLAKANGANLFMDANGLVGNIGLTNVYQLEQGSTDELNKYDMSLDNLSVIYDCGGRVTANMLGRIDMPWCGTKGKDDAPLLRYSFRYANNRYEVFVKDNDKGSFGGNKYTLSTGSGLVIEVRKEDLQIVTLPTEKPTLAVNVYKQSICRDYPATLTASQCPDGKQLVWSTGDTGGSIVVRPLVNTTYTVKCQDKYCVSAVSDSLKITVHDSLPQPTLLTGRDAICRYEGTDIQADNCVGKMEWQIPGNTAFKEYGSDQRSQHVNFANVSKTSTFNYTARCNLNGCLSPAIARSVTVHPEPGIPNLYSNAANNTIDRNEQVTLSGNCNDGTRLIWEDLPNATMTLVSSATYHAVCRNDATGCQSQEMAAIGINVLYFPPAAPSNLAVLSVNSHSVTFAWKDNSYNEDGFLILRSTNADFSNAQEVGRVGTDKINFSNGGLSEGITYYYQVISFNKYDRGYSELLAVGILVTPGRPQLSTDSDNIVRGSEANVWGSCGVGQLVWVSPGGFRGGRRPQNDQVTYQAVCDNQGVRGEIASLTVRVYSPAPGVPQLSVQRSSIERGSKAVVYGSCASGTLVWTAPEGFNGGEWTQYDNMTYHAKCVNDGGESGIAYVAVSVFDLAQAPRPSLRAEKNPVKPGETTNIYADGCDGGTIRWSTGATGYSINAGPGDYSAICEKPGHINSEGSRITIYQGENPQAPRPNLRADKNTVRPGETTNIYADGCEGGTVRWSTGAAGYSINVGSGDYSAICEKPGHTNSESGRITIYQGENPQAPRPNLRADKNPVKPGETTNIYADGCDGGMIRWSTGATGYSINVGPGEYSAMCEKPGHTNSDRSVMSISLCNPPTQPSISTDDIRIPYNGRGILVASGCDNGDVSWSTGATGRSIEVYNAGNYTVTCTIRNECGSISVSDGANVTKEDAPCQNPPSPQIIGESNVNPGQFFELRLDGCAGSTVRKVWSGEDVYVNENNFQIYGGSINNATEFRVICSKSGCLDASVSKIVNVNENIPTPNVSPQIATSCSGSAANVSVTGCPSNQFQWRNTSSNAEGNTSGTTFQTFNGGRYEFKCISNGRTGGSSSATVQIVKLEKAPSVSGPSEVLSGDNFTLTASGCMDNGYSWSPLGTFNNFFDRSRMTSSINSATTFVVKCRLFGCEGLGAEHRVTASQVPDPKSKSDCVFYFVKPYGPVGSGWAISYVSCDGERKLLEGTWGDNNPGFYMEAQKGKIISDTRSDGGGCNIHF